MLKKHIINGRFLFRRLTGNERYGQEILRHLPQKLRVVCPPRIFHGAAGHLWEQFILPGLVAPDQMLWSPANTGPLAVTNQVVTIHDLTPLEHPKWFRPTFAMWYQWFMPRLIGRVRRVLVSSAHVRGRLLQRFALPADRVTVIPGGVDPQQFHPLSGSAENYILFVGTLEPRKNLSGLLQAWSAIQDKHTNLSLVIAGSAGKVFRKLNLPTKPKRVHFVGYVPQADLPRLYAKATAFVMPSFDEGFGLPLLEAMACGTPVLAARAGALPETASDAALFFDPHQPVDFAAQLDRLLRDAPLRQTLREAGLARARHFSWQHSAEQLWQVLETCQNSPTSPLS